MNKITSNNQIEMDIPLQYLSKTKKQIRKQLKQRTLKTKFKGNYWREIIQIHKSDKIIKSDNFKQAICNNQDLNCPICLALMVFPSILSCGHIFCKPCIEEATLLNNICPICRTPNNRQYFTVCRAIDDLIVNIRYASLKGQQKKRYDQRRRDYIIWQHLLSINPEFRIGELVHFYDIQQTGWRYGVITRVRVHKQKQLYLKVQPLQQQQFQQCYQFHYLSKRIAQIGFFNNSIEFRKNWQGKLRQQQKTILRDQQMRRTVQKRILDKTIRQVYCYQWIQEYNKWRTTHRVDSSLSKNVRKYIPSELRHVDYQAVYSYSFDQFHAEGQLFYDQSTINQQTSLQINSQISKIQI